MKNILIFTLLFSLNAFSQSLGFYKSDIIPEIIVGLPGDVFISETRDEKGIPSFTLYDEDDSYEFTVMLFDTTTGTYAFSGNLGVYNKEMAYDMEYRESVEYLKGEIDNGITFNIYKGLDDKDTVYFGVIHDIQKKKLYDIELLCYSISDETASKIISSINFERINKKVNISGDYPQVQIGNQTWMSQNLDVDHFRNGDIIPEVKTREDWIAMYKKREPAWCYYKNESSDNKVYGKLYNYFAVIDERGLAPIGWKIPNNDEWLLLSSHWRDCNEQQKYMSKENWQKGQTSGLTDCENCFNWSNEYERKVPCHVCKDTRTISIPKKWIDENGTNEYGFNAQPSGYRTVWSNHNDDFIGKGEMACWWVLFSDKDVVRRPIELFRCAQRLAASYYEYKHYATFDATAGDGLAIRCIKE